MTNLVAARARVRGDECGRGHDLPRRAEAALHGVGADERVDQRMVAQAYDRRDLCPVDRMDERDARERWDAVDQHRARAAMALAARDLRAGEAEIFAQHLRERAADRSVDLVAAAVDLELRQESSPPRCPRGG